MGIEIQHVLAIHVNGRKLPVLKSQVNHVVFIVVLLEEEWCATTNFGFANGDGITLRSYRYRALERCIHSGLENACWTSESKGMEMVFAVLGQVKDLQSIWCWTAKPIPGHTAETPNKDGFGIDDLNKTNGKRKNELFFYFRKQIIRPLPP